MPSITIKPAVGTDDAHIGNTGTYTNGNTLQVGNISSVRRMFVRFIGAAIQQGAIIEGAYLDLTPDGSRDNSIYENVFGHDADTGSAPTTSGGIDALALTTATVAWDFSTVGTTPITSPNLAAIIQEIVDRPGWVSGNDITLVLYADAAPTNSYSSVVSRNASAVTCPSLTIIIKETGGAGQQEVMIL